jgi:FdhE protein
MPPMGKANGQVDATVQELDGLTKQTPELAEAAAFYRAALPLLRQYRQDVAPFRMEQPAARSKLEAGLPLLVGEELPLDSQAARALFLKLCRIVEGARASGESSPGDRVLLSGRLVDAFSLWKRAQDGDGGSLRAAAARQIRRAVEHNDLDLPAVWAMLAAGDGRRLELTAAGLKLDAELLRTLAQYSLKPAFQRWAQGLQEVVGFDRWRRGYCPVCGSSPSLSELQEKERARRLRCGLCGAGWRYPHLQCAFCQNNNYKLLSYFSVEGEEDRYTLQACDVCQGYIKVIKTFEPIPVDLLPVQDLATLHLDLIAAEHEYARTTAGLAASSSPLPRREI